MENFNLKEFFGWLYSRTSGKVILMVIITILAIVFFVKIVPVLLLIIGLAVIALLLFGKNIDIKQLIEKIKDFKNKIENDSKPME